MLRILILLLIPLSTLLTSMSVGEQAFEGKIIYANSYKSKNPQITDQQWNTMMGVTQEYFIKGGDYKSTANGSLVQWQLYINKENKFYSKMSNSESVFWNDAGVQGDEVLNTEIHKNVTTILGYSCDELILTCRSGVQKYYFHSKLSVDAKLYAKHKFGNWYDYLTKAHALPLKSITENAQFIMESIATNVQPMKLDKKMFTLPAGVKTEESKY